MCWKTWKRRLTFWKTFPSSPPEPPAAPPPAHAVGGDPLLYQTLKTCVDHLIEERRRDRRWVRVRRALFGLVMVSAVGVMWYPRLQDMDSSGPEKGKVAVIELKGEIGSESAVSAAKVSRILQRLDRIKDVKEVVLYIDSPGGQPAEAERIGQALEQIKARGLPVLAVAGNTMTSAAYMVALRGDEIVVPKYSLVGSIGVIMTRWDVSELANTLGVKYKAITSGPYKAMLDPMLPMNDSEEKVAHEIVRTLADKFLVEVKQRRAGKYKLDDAQLGSGGVWDGEKAVELGLADRVGTLEDILHMNPEWKPVYFSISDSPFSNFVAQTWVALRSAVFEGMR